LARTGRGVEIDWALSEFGSAALGDARRSARLVELARQLGARPQSSVPQACAEWAETKAAYRFFDNEHIEHEAVLAAHVCTSVQRMRAHRVVLAVQDTTVIDYAGHRATAGLGPLNRPIGWGLLCHGTLAFTPQRLPLGVLDVKLWARDPDQAVQAPSRRARPIEDKESYKWIESLDALVPIQKLLADTTLVSVGDREADIFEFFVAAKERGLHVLVRAAWDRNLEPNGKLIGTLEQAPVLAHQVLSVPRQGQRPARRAHLELRAGALQIKPPCHRHNKALRPINMWGLLALERHAPDGTAPIRWLVLCSLPITSAEHALERLDWYVCRWGIEQWHKVLKSGCKIEARQLQSFERLQRMIALYAVIAWRILYATLLGRVHPELPCTVLLEIDEWQTLWCRIHQRAHPPPTAPPLAKAIAWIGRLGGHLGRKHDGPPGTMTLWRGFQELIPMTEMYRIMKPARMPDPSISPRNVGND
jgi:hypothetical protein